MSATTVRCECAGYALELISVDYDAIPGLLRSEADAGRRVLDLGDSRCRSQAAIHLAASADDHIHWELTLAESRTSGLSTDKFACFDDRIAVAIGGYVVCIKVPTGEVMWIAEGDGACCFGVHALSSESAVVVHGELEISKLTLDGEIVWQSGGEDIFTGPFEIEETGIRAVDFNGKVYWIRLDTGESKVIGQGQRPWPHTG